MLFWLVVDINYGFLKWWIPKSMGFNNSQILDDLGDPHLPPELPPTSVTSPQNSPRLPRTCKPLEVYPLISTPKNDPAQLQTATHSRQQPVEPTKGCRDWRFTTKIKHVSVHSHLRCLTSASFSLIYIFY